MCIFEKILNIRKKKVIYDIMSEFLYINFNRITHIYPTTNKLIQKYKLEEKVCNMNSSNRLLKMSSEEKGRNGEVQLRKETLDNIGFKYYNLTLVKTII